MDHSSISCLATENVILLALDLEASLGRVERERACVRDVILLKMACYGNNMDFNSDVAVSE